MIEIVFPKPEDAEAIQMVFYKSWLDTYPNKEVGITIDDVEHWYKDDWNGKIEKQRARIVNPPENQSFFIAKDGDLVVGVCRILKHSDKNEPEKRDRKRELMAERHQSAVTALELERVISEEQPLTDYPTSRSPENKEVLEKASAKLGPILNRLNEA